MILYGHSVQFLSRVWLCDPIDCSMPSFFVHHQLAELTQTHVHWVGDTIQLSHLLSSPSPPVFNLSQHHNEWWVGFPASWFFASGGQSTGVLASTSVLPMIIQDWFPLGWASWISLQLRDSQESSPTPQFNSSVLSLLYSPTLTSIHDHRKNHSLD